MIRRPLRPHFSFDDRTRLLRDMGTVRRLALTYGGAAGYGTREHELADDVMRAIDAMATAMTGDKTYYHDKPHGGGFGATMDR